MILSISGFPKFDEMPGVPLQELWGGISPAGLRKEGPGYQTQKPEALLDRIIKTSSKEGNLVLDPFYGCGTAIARQRVAKLHA